MLREDPFADPVCDGGGGSATAAVTLGLADVLELIIGVTHTVEEDDESMPDVETVGLEEELERSSVCDCGEGCGLGEGAEDGAKDDADIGVVDEELVTTGCGCTGIKVLNEGWEVCVGKELDDCTKEVAVGGTGDCSVVLIGTGIDVGAIEVTVAGGPRAEEEPGGPDSDSEAIGWSKTSDDGGGGGDEAIGADESIEVIRVTSCVIEVGTLVAVPFRVKDAIARIRSWLSNGVGSVVFRPAVPDPQSGTLFYVLVTRLARRFSDKRRKP